MTDQDRTVIGIDLGGTKVAAGRVRSDGTLEALAARRVPADDSVDAVLEVIFDAVDEVATTAVEAIGCGVPSVVDIEDGIVRSVSNIPSWRAVALSTRLEERFGVPATIDNDANLFALGEYTSGAGREARHLVGITLGTGLGSGVIIDGRVVRGANCGAGELGKTDRRGMRLEDWCAGPYFEREWGETADELHRRAAEGDADAIRAFEAYGEQLSTAIARALYLFDPEIIVLGGSISRAFDLFEPTMRSGLTGFAFPHIVERVRIVPSELEHAAVLGAAVLALDVARSRT
jgi:glucokinase